MLPLGRRQAGPARQAEALVISNVGNCVVDRGDPREEGQGADEADLRPVGHCSSQCSSMYLAIAANVSPLSFMRERLDESMPVPSRSTLILA